MSKGDQEDMSVERVRSGKLTERIWCKVLKAGSKDLGCLSKQNG